LPVGHIVSRSAAFPVPPERVWDVIYNAFFRFVSRYIVGHHRTIDSFLGALRRHLDARGG
jgi:hypothetical protein